MLCRRRLDFELHIPLTYHRRRANGRLLRQVPDKARDKGPQQMIMKNGSRPSKACVRCATPPFIALARPESIYQAKAQEVSHPGLNISTSALLGTGRNFFMRLFNSSPPLRTCFRALVMASRSIKSLSRESLK